MKTLTARRFSRAMSVVFVAFLAFAARRLRRPTGCDMTEIP